MVASAPAPKVKQVKLVDVGLDASALDRSADPCNDFYQFACGGWIARTKIPADRPRWMRSFSEIAKANEQTLRAILEGAAKAKGEGPLARLGAFYRACMNDGEIEARGLAPVQALWQRALKINKGKELLALITELHREQTWVLFSTSAEQDFKDTTKIIASLDQGGLGLPDRDQYLKDDAKSKKLRAAYVQHVQRMMVLAGRSQKQAAQAAADVMVMETTIARFSKTRVARRDPRGMYNKLTRDGLTSLAPGFDWKGYFTGLGRPDIVSINITSKPFFEGVMRLLREQSVRRWRHYLSWHVLHDYADALPKGFMQEDFALRKVLTGQQEIKPRWKRCIASTDSALGELLAQPFVERRFSVESKGAVMEMVAAISTAFRAQVDKLPWMDAVTRARAKEKLARMAYLIGYPDKWKRYDFALGADHVTNLRAAARFDLKRTLTKIGRPVNPKEWEMTPPTVNAYYHPLKNHMVFPAGILQPPFFNPRANLAVNLGGMGMVVAHELTHGFDDQGSKFDAQGNLHDWWTPASRQSFEKQTRCVQEQYGGYEALPGLKVNGKLTLGENIADIGGVKLAFQAFRQLRAGAEEVVVAEGFSESQQFFLSVGQIWCGKQREQLARLRALTDPHSPPRHRVNGSLTNSKAFARAFRCEANTPMNPSHRCDVW
ncbi:MAG: M13 family metallopeptidase [Deltaproteobacteria bacterium]|nr:M13 family metallopeptidase [Deltaproteobacteria bacterium]